MYNFLYLILYQQPLFFGLHIETQQTNHYKKHWKQIIKEENIHITNKIKNFHKASFKKIKQTTKYKLTYNLSLEKLLKQQI